MEDNIHPLTRLILKRIESHPEEFVDEDRLDVYVRSRWGYALTTIRQYGTDADRAALQAAENVLHMENAHNWALDELLNGEDRRAEQQRREELLKQHTYVAQQQSLSAAQLQGLKAYSANTVMLGGK